MRSSSRFHIGAVSRGARLRASAYVAASHSIVLLFVLCASWWPSVAMAQPVPATPAAAPQVDEYTSRIQPIFDGRCVACHSCFNAPCQLNLQSYSGVARGGTIRSAYDRLRPHSVPPTRPDIDATSTGEWRAKGFWDVLGASGAAQSNATGVAADGRSLLLALTRLRATHASLQPTKSVADAQYCPADIGDGRLAGEPAQLGMPYGLPPLVSYERDALASWIAHGAPGPVAGTGRDTVPAQARADVGRWESFLNGTDPRQVLVSRYLYEHLFLAHLYFEADPAVAPGGKPTWLRLVRSRTGCSTGIDEIATRRPNDDPGAAKFYYCLRPYDGTIVDKTHIPYGLSDAKLARFEALFLGSDWTAPAQPPTYDAEVAGNPFVAFAAIPVRSRYQFLLDDARYEIATFIKGPVCNGSTAVDSIQEQFFVFFLKPDADSMVALPDHAAAGAGLLVLPGMRGSDVTLLQNLPYLTRLVERREQYRRLRATTVRALRPKGYALEDVWDGEGQNPNAVLTVFRHFDNAAVYQGAVGDLSKTVFVLDYPLMERLVYNLVVNFDVFGNVGHQSLTRLYMDMIRMEAEELFLSFLPPAQRQPLRDDWYRGGVLTDIKLHTMFPLLNTRHPTATGFHTARSASPQAFKAELVQRLLFERMTAPVRGASDTLNWRRLQPAAGSSTVSLTPTEQSLRRLASVPAKASPFTRYFPDLATVLLRRADGSRQLYTIVHNREHANVSWIGGESLRLTPAEDTLTIRSGILGAYPNMFFVLEEGQVETFSRTAARIRSSADYDRLVARWGVPRTTAGFWPVYDEINALFRRSAPVEAGVLDLTRYALAGE